MSKNALPQNQVYSHLIIYRQRRLGLVFLCITLTLGICAWLWLHLHFRRTVPWGVFSLPIAVIGILCCRVKPSEEWNYSPWQKSPQRFERNIYD